METYNTFIEVYSQGDPFYTNEAMKWIELCHEPMRMAQEIKIRSYINTHSSAYLKDRLVNLQPADPDIVTKNVSYTTSSILYGVQVSATITPNYTIDFPGLKNVGVYVDENKIYRYVIGNLSFRSQAVELLYQVRMAGYDDAFIVDINQPELFGEEVVAINNHSVNIKLKGKVEFRVQVGAFAEKLPRKLSKTYLEIDKLKEVKENKLTILTAGKFDAYEEAKTHTEMLRSNGFEDAFVTAFNRGRRIPVSMAVKHLNSGSIKDITPQKRGK
ncbi:MAG: SPOR domain-containing protein, partial [Flavobacteriales bacterium]|nr:SPOR domain-containing protein [Flavobacteriales bacterium]